MPLLPLHTPMHGPLGRACCCCHSLATGYASCNPDASETRQLCCRADLRAFKMRLLANHTAAALAWEASALQGNPQDVFLYDLSKVRADDNPACAGEPSWCLYLFLHFPTTQAADTGSAHVPTILLRPPMLLHGQVMWTAEWQGHRGAAHAQTQVNCA